MSADLLAVQFNDVDHVEASRIVASGGAFPYTFPEAPDRQIIVVPGLAVRPEDAVPIEVSIPFIDRLIQLNLLGLLYDPSVQEVHTWFLMDGYQVFEDYYGREKTWYFSLNA